MSSDLVNLRLVVEGPDFRKEYTVKEYPCLIGRETDCLVRIPSTKVSRRHAKISLSDTTLSVQDLESRNGTYLNGARVDIPTTIKHGDLIRFGKDFRALVVLDIPKRPKFDPTLRQPASSQGITRSIVGQLRSEDLVSLQDSKTLAILLEISKALNSSLDYETVLNLVLDAVIEITRVQRGFLLIKNGDRMEVSLARNSNQESLEPDEHLISYSAVNQVIEHNKPTLVYDALENEKFRDQESIARLHLNTILGVPLHVYEPGEGNGVRERLIGMIYADSTQSTPQEAQRLLDLMTALAGHAANAIENARMHQQLIEKERMEEDLKIAREIQDSLLPRRFKLKGNWPCELHHHCIQLRQVGGDYYFFQSDKPGHLELAMGDVMGKGLPASLMMAVLSAGIDALSPKTDSLEELVSDLNNLLAKQTAKNKYITLFTGIVRDGVLEYVNAGHNPPLLFREDGTVLELTEGGMILGVIEDNPYTASKVELHPGDLLVVYTDGLVESVDPRGEEFSMERLKQFGTLHRKLSAEQFLKQLLEALDVFVETAPRVDDLTIMTLKWTG